MNEIPDLAFGNKCSLEDSNTYRMDSRGVGHSSFADTGSTMATYYGMRVDMLTSHLTPALAPPAPVYADPEPKENKAKNTRRYYVEAVTNHKFAVNVTLTSTFLMGNCDGVKISMKFDGGTEWHHFISRLQHVSGPHLAVATFTFFPEYDENLKQWTRGEFSFGRLDTRT